ncbi:hypothetical protein [Cerasicoccus frondis]|uniref:hypothetical protein n=1 Tax=Cerasicoccus frondis TaxID=490090 RepID=UPI002852A1B7|nr:hypothetical protein [Cerasicoccus frondis]
MRLFPPFCLLLVLTNLLCAENPATAFPSLPSLETVNGAQQRKRAIDLMQRNFARWSTTPRAYQQRLDRECGIFPEGHLYPYFLPAIAFTQLAVSDPANQRLHLEHAQKYLKHGLPIAAKIVKAPGENLLNLEDYQRQATTLSTVSIALGLYHRAGGSDPDLDQCHRHVNRLLANALQEAKGGPIRSYPTYAWNSDTVLSLLGLRLAPQLTPDVSVDTLWTRHQAWIDANATDSATQLPYSIAGFGDPTEPKPPRSCDLMMRVQLIAQVDPPAAQELFSNVRRSMERKVGNFYGFDEYPQGVAGWEDNDSGPIVMDMGLSATGMAIGAALATENTEIADRLCQQFAFREPLLMMAQYMDLSAMAGGWFWQGVKIDPEYFTGFLFGDAVLFCSLTWAPVEDS